MLSDRKEHLKLVLEAGKVNLRRQGRLNVAKLKVSVSKNKVVHNKKISAVKGYELNRGKLKKMTSVERLHRRMATRKARFKIRAKLAQSRRKWKAAMRKRHALGG